MALTTRKIGGCWDYRISDFKWPAYKPILIGLIPLQIRSTPTHRVMRLLDGWGTTGLPRLDLQRDTGGAVDFGYAAHVTEAFFARRLGFEVVLNAVREMLSFGLEM